jgi:hypothetical protein
MAWKQEIESQSAQPNSVKTGQVIIRDESGEYICKVHHSRANLIASTPDLLEALRVLVDHAQERYPHFESERGLRDIRQALDVINKIDAE